MKIAVGQVKQEANHFNPRRCTLEHFEVNGLLYGQEVLEKLGPHTELAGAVASLRRAGAEIAPLMLARSVTYGPLTSECWQTLLNGMLSRLREALPVDGVYFSLHGAMAVEDDDDPEGTLIAAAREIVGPGVPIAASFDLHAHMTPKICGNANIVEGYHTYPHDDGFETGGRAADGLLRTVRGEIKPVISLAKVPMLLPGTNQQTAWGAASLLWYDANQAVSQGEAYSISLFCCHTKLDIPDIGFAAVVITDGAPRTDLAQRLCRQAWELREEFRVQMVPPREAVRRALAVDRGPVVLVDLGDVPGGGSTGDSNAMLAAMLAEGVDQLKEPSQVSVVDPEAAEACHAAGVGAKVTLALGNKMNPALGEPIEVTGYVKTLHDGRFRWAMGNLRGSPGSMGRCAVLQVGSVNVLVTTYPSYEYADEQYRAVGLDLDTCRISVARAGMNFKLAFKERARHMILVDGPGPTTPAVERLPFTRLNRPFWPLDPEMDLKIHTWSF